MAICSECEALVGALKSVQPHGGLTETEKRPYKSGIGPALAAGYMRYYSCGNCGSRWMRDCDEKDADASWTLRS